MTQTPSATGQPLNQVIISSATRTQNLFISSAATSMNEHQFSESISRSTDQSVESATTQSELASNQYEASEVMLDDPRSFDIYDKKWDHIFAKIDGNLGIRGTFEELERTYNVGSTLSQVESITVDTAVTSHPRETHAAAGAVPRSFNFPLPPEINPFKENGEPKMVHQTRLLREFLGGERFQRDLNTVVLAPGKSDTLHNRKSAIIRSLCAEERSRLMSFVKEELVRKRGGGSDTTANSESSMSSSREIDASLAAFDYGTMAENLLEEQNTTFTEYGNKDRRNNSASGETSQRTKTILGAESGLGISSSPTYSAQNERKSAEDGKNSAEEADPDCYYAGERRNGNLPSENHHHMGFPQLADTGIDHFRTVIPDQTPSFPHPRNDSIISPVQVFADTETGGFHGHNSRDPGEYTDLGSEFGISSFISHPNMSSSTSQHGDEVPDTAMGGMSTSVDNAVLPFSN